MHHLSPLKCMIYGTIHIFTIHTKIKGYQYVAFLEVHDLIWRAPDLNVNIM